jgi:hypothetical protein
MLTSRHQNAGQNHTTGMANRFFARNILFDIMLTNVALTVITVRLSRGIIVLIGFSLYVSSVRKIFVIVHVFSYGFLEEHVTK